MAAPLHLLTLLSLLLPILSHSLTPCHTLAFPSYTTCLALPTLAATLHYTFHSSNSTLSVAFTAAPSSPNGWVAWGINPASPSMFGTQALLAYVSSNGSAFVGTYNITSTDVAPGKISYDVTGVSAEYNGGNLTVFGDWAIPKGVEVINQVWQVGPAVAAGGRPAKHDMKPANLASVGTLRLVSGGGGSASAAPAPAPSYTTFLALPTLAATLRYTFHSSNSTLSVAFTAAPSSPNGWVAWGINPASRSMFGTQALLAYVSSNGSAFVGTYNITSTDVAPGKISYGVTGVSAEYNGGNLTVFGDWAIPKGVEVINQVWQVGPAVAAGGRPAKHDMKPANLGSVGTLRLVSGGGGSGSAAPAPAPAPESGGGKKSAGSALAPSGGAVVRSCAVGVMMGVLLGVFGLTMF